MTVVDTVDSSGIQELDALIVGAGFAGIYQLKVLRDVGFNVRLVDSAADYGGVWYWNRYPGARVDSDVPHYEFSDPVLWQSWTWKQRFPGGAEIRAYLAHVAEKWDLRKDTQFDTEVVAATWDEAAAKWTVRTRNLKTFQVKYLLLNLGFAAKRYIPNWPGQDSFKGVFIHPSQWPHEDPDLSDKKVAIIGTGATGIQIAQEVSKVASHLTVFQRTINMPLPMKQVKYDQPYQAVPHSDYQSFFDSRTTGFSGFAFTLLSRNTMDDTPEQREKTYEELWAKCDFHFWLGTYQDMFFNWDANREAYSFWRKKTLARIRDTRIADILAPAEQPYAFGCKRVAMENGFFEIFNQPNVELVDVSKNGTPIGDITPSGLITTDGKEYDFDYIICATGFDSFTGGYRQIDIRNEKGQSIAEHWQNGTKTYLGMAVAGFPNMLFTYGPQAPTAFCNGPTCAELQGDFILRTLQFMREKGYEKIDAKAESEEDWARQVKKLADMSLIPTVDSWYMGANIPGKIREPLVYVGGVPAYYKTLNEEADKGYPGFHLSGRNVSEARSDDLKPHL